MMVKILFSLAAAAVVLGNPVTKSMVKEQQQQAAKLASDVDRVPVPVVSATYRLNDQILEKKQKLKKRSVFEELPDGLKIQDRFPGFLSQLLYKNFYFKTNNFRSS